MCKQLVSYFLATTLVVFVALLMLKDSKRCSENRIRTDVSSLSNLTFSQLSQFLLDNYDLSVGDDTKNLDDRLHGAILGMERAEKDGKPVPIQNHSYLFVGSAGPTFRRDILQEYGITHIIGLSRSIRPRFPNDFVYLSINSLEDSSSNNITQYFGPTTQFIEKAREQNGKVLVHCWMGTSRSVSIIIAYLMKVDQIPYKEATNLVRETREQANPIPHFVEELEKYEKVVLHD